jgi:hypothetical protein
MGVSLTFRLSRPWILILLSSWDCMWAMLPSKIFQAVVTEKKIFKNAAIREGQWRVKGTWGPFPWCPAFSWQQEFSFLTRARHGKPMKLCGRFPYLRTGTLRHFIHFGILWNSGNCLTILALLCLINVYQQQLNYNLNSNVSVFFFFLSVSWIAVLAAMKCGHS